MTKEDEKGMKGADVSVHRRRCGSGSPRDGGAKPNVGVTGENEMVEQVEGSEVSESDYCDGETETCREDIVACKREPGQQVLPPPIHEEASGASASGDGGKETSSEDDGHDGDGDSVVAYITGSTPMPGQTVAEPRKL